MTVGVDIRVCYMCVYNAFAMSLLVCNQFPRQINQESFIIYNCRVEFCRTFQHLKSNILAITFILQHNKI